MQSKRFVIVSFFTTLTLSVVCQGIFGIVSELMKEGWPAFKILSACYAIAFSCFLIKYYIDDVIDDNGGISEVVSRFSLARLIIGWMFFLIAALFVCDVKVSSVIWCAGLFVLTWFLIHSREQLEDETKFWRYLGENVVLMLSLAFIFVAFVMDHGMCKWISVCGTLAIVSLAFFVMLSDRTPAIGQFNDHQSGKDL